MRSMRYLNAVLTVLAVLLAANVWALISAPERSLLQPESALAQSRSTGAAPAAGAAASGIPDAGSQRKEIIDALKRIAAQNEELANLLRSGSVRVKVEAAAQPGK